MLQANHADALSKLGIALFQLGRHDEAAAKMRQLVELQPTSPAALSNLAMAMVTLKRGDEAKQFAERALALKADYQPALTNLGQALSLLGEVDGAAAAHAKALALEPGRADLYANRSVSLIELGQVDAAIDVLRDALRRFPDYYPAINNLGGALLMAGQFEEGWQVCDRFWQHDNNASWRARYSWPLWNGEDIAGRSLLVWGEQGIGDVILFASMLPDLLQRGARLTLEVDARLVSLFQRSFPTIAVIARADNAPAGPFERQVNIGRLGLLLRPDSASFAGQRPFLTPDPARVGDFKARYAALHPGPKIGIAWRSNSPSYRRKSIGLEAWTPLLKRTDLCFVSLQYGDVAEDLRLAKDKLDASIVHDTSFDTWADLDGLAAQIASLDAVVSVSNLNVHIAGAQAIPTHVLLTSNALWYWPHNAAATPWYSALQIHRLSGHASTEAMLRHVTGRIAGST
jgi:tetratricopeptide (TPR) repeat protein